MWWKKLSRSGKSEESPNKQISEVAGDGPFDFERTLRELSERKDDIRPSDVVVFAEPLRSTLNFAIQIGKISLTDFANMMSIDISQARQLTELLVARNLLHVSPFSNKNEVFYETRVSTMTRPLVRVKNNILKKLDE